MCGKSGGFWNKWLKLFSKKACAARLFLFISILPEKIEHGYLMQLILMISHYIKTVTAMKISLQKWGVLIVIYFLPFSNPHGSATLFILGSVQNRNEHTALIKNDVIAPTIKVKTDL